MSLRHSAGRRPRDAGTMMLWNASVVWPAWGDQLERRAPAAESAVQVTRASALPCQAAHESGVSDSRTASSERAGGANHPRRESQLRRAASAASRGTANGTRLRAVSMGSTGCSLAIVAPQKPQRGAWTSAENATAAPQSPQRRTWAYSGPSAGRAAPGPGKGQIAQRRSPSSIAVWHLAHELIAAALPAPRHRSTRARAVRPRRRWGCGNSRTRSLGLASMDQDDDGCDEGGGDEDGQRHLPPGERDLAGDGAGLPVDDDAQGDRKSTSLNSSHVAFSR